MPANVTNGGGIDGLLNFERGPLKDSGEHVGQLITLSISSLRLTAAGDLVQPAVL